MAQLDDSHAIAVFEEHNGRKPMATEIEQVRHAAIVVPNFMAMMGHLEDAVEAWAEAHKPPPVPEGFVDWEAYNSAMMMKGVG